MHRAAKATSPCVIPTPRSKIVRMTSLFAQFGRDRNRRVTSGLTSFMNSSGVSPQNSPQRDAG